MLVWKFASHVDSCFPFSRTCYHNLIMLKAFLQKGCIKLFGPISIFCRINPIFGGLTCFAMKTLFYNCFCRFALRSPEIMYAKTSVLQAASLWANLSKVDFDMMQTWTILLAALTCMFWFWNKWGNRPKKSQQNLYWTGVRTKQIHICPVQHLNCLG